MINFVKVLRKDLQKPENPPMTYALAQSIGTLDINKVAEHMVQHGCNYDEGDIVAVTKKLVGCVRELLLEGYHVNLGDLGTFGVRLLSYPVCESVADEDTGKKPTFTADNIRAVRVFWNRSAKFHNLVQSATFHETLTHKAKALVKAQADKQIADGTYDGSKYIVTTFARKPGTDDPDEEVHE